MNKIIFKSLVYFFFLIVSYKSNNAYGIDQENVKLNNIESKKDTKNFLPVSKYLNLKFYFLGPFVNSYGVNLNIKISKRLSAGPIYKYFNRNDVNKRQDVKGLELNFSPTGMDIFDSGLFLNGRVEHVKNFRLMKSDTYILGANILYQQVLFESRFHLSTYFGIRYITNPRFDDNIYTKGTDQLQANLDFLIGVKL